MARPTFSRRHFAISGASFLLAAPLPLRAARAGALPSILAYRDPGCGCCEKWVTHLQNAGFTVTMQDDTNRDARRRAARVPDSLASCHTAFAGPYAIEGHVPAEAIKRLLAEKPVINGLPVLGLAVPGMPVGSPGMEYGDQVDPYTVFSFLGDGTTNAFASYGS